jgi:beta-galactosidase
VTCRLSRAARRLIVPAVLLLLAIPNPALAQRQRLSMDLGWRFTLGDPAGAERPVFDDGAWRRLDLPHDWSIEGIPDQQAPGGGRMGYFPGGIGWYRKAFRMPALPTGGRAWLEFDGVYEHSDVWVNGVHLGHRPYGYISFAYDVTPHLKPGINVVAVRVDNSNQPNSRWYTGSGIYRHVWLTTVAPVHVAHWGVTVTTPTADSARGRVVVRTRLENAAARPRRVTVRQSLLAPTGGEASHAEETLELAAGERREVAETLEVASPRRWSVDDPALYALRTSLLEGARTVDTVTTVVGIRSISWSADSGFALNGRRLKLLGVNLHHDAGALGAAVPERVWEHRLELMKAMGVNAVRTSHNPPAPEFLDLCDRLGLLVMAEAFDEWTHGKVPHGYATVFEAWAERDVADFVRRDRNHPSIVLWSAGNEIGEQVTPEGHEVLRRLLEVFHREDPTRPVTTGNDNIAADGRPATEAFLEALDVVGYNYVDRWRDRRETFAEADKRAHPDWIMVGTESGTIFQSFRERHTLGDDPGVPRPNYASGMTDAERRWKWIAMRDWFAGDFMWTGYDYLGEATWPFVGFPSGMVDLGGQPKDMYYLWRSQWTREPVLHLFPHWTWPGREGQVLPVLAYTNCNVVELYQDGRLLGQKRLEFPAQGTSGGWNSYALPRVHPTTNDLHLAWDVSYAPGELRAVGRWRDGSPCAEARVRTAGRPAQLRLRADRDTITTGFGDVVHVRFELTDSHGTVVPDADLPVRFTVTGGRILALDNGDLEDKERHRRDVRRTYGGRGLAIARGDRAGTLALTATAEGVGSAEIRITVVPGAAPPAVPAAR